MRIILIGNYPLDRQESMERFAVMLNDGFNKYEKLSSEIWRPTVVFGGLGKSTLFGFGKWLGYLDKWIIFPLIIRTRIYVRKLNNKHVNFHVCDHSNAYYLKQLPGNNKAITCHDVIAIRAAFGCADAHNPTSRLGLYLQKWILSNLGKAKKLAAVSRLSLNQLSALVPDEINSKEKWRVIHNAFNAHFYPMVAANFQPLLRKCGLGDNPRFLLHVGSELPRKNRKILVEMLNELGDNYDGDICFAGNEIDEELSAYIEQCGLSSRVKSVVKPDHDALVALYSACDAFIFPSFSEGFGWPLIEAQACGAVVITSNIEPMPEVTGNIALYADPYEAKTFAKAFLNSRNDELKTKLIQRGFQNADNFQAEYMIRKYVRLHQINNYL